MQVSCFSIFKTSETDDTERSSPIEESGMKSKTESTDELIDSKDHVNVIFIGHVGKYKSFTQKEHVCKICMDDEYISLISSLLI